MHHAIPIPVPYLMSLAKELVEHFARISGPPGGSEVVREKAVIQVTSRDMVRYSLERRSGTPRGSAPSVSTNTAPPTRGPRSAGPPRSAAGP